MWTARLLTFSLLGSFFVLWQPDVAVVVVLAEEQTQQCNSNMTTTSPPPLEQQQQQKIEDDPSTALPCDTVAVRRQAEAQRKALLSLEERSEEFGVRQVAEGKERLDTLRRIQATIDYVTYSESYLNLSSALRDECKNKDKLCSFWAAIGECKGNNVGWITENCAPACQACEMLDINRRCPMNSSAVPALQPGELAKMFERIVAEAPGNRTLNAEELAELQASKTPLYTVHVHSRPSPKTPPWFGGWGDSSEPPDPMHGLLFDQFVPPWVVTFDNFLTSEECDTLIDYGFRYGFGQSLTVGPTRYDGSVTPITSVERTSESAWCTSWDDETGYTPTSGCRNAEIPRRIHERISKILRIPTENSEDFQILKYETNQFYATHHDYVPLQAQRPCGPRILTFFLYLSDVEEGGETEFPVLEIKIKPKKGRALLWPSISNSNPMAKDGRTDHQALPVIKGTKFAANGWIHLYNYQQAQRDRCV